MFQPPYRVDLGGISIVALDSANACDQGSLHQKYFDRQFAEIQSLVGKTPASNRVWLHTHRPLWAVKQADSTTPKQDLDPSGSYEIIDHTLQQAYAMHPLPRPVQLVLSGHMHRFQAIGFPPTGNDQRPPQLVVGNGGVALAGNHPKQPFSLSIDGMTGIGFGISEFGYMTVQLGYGDGWKGQLLDRKGKKMAECDSSRLTKTGICAPAK